MKILYDYQAFCIQKIGGISRYFYEILSNLPESTKYDLGLEYSNNIYIKQNFKKTIKNYKEDYLKNYNFLGKKLIIKSLKRFFPSKFPNYIDLNKEYTLKLLNENNFDIFHPTYYDPYFLNQIGKKPFILTIHDMIHELYPEFYNSNDNTSLQKKILANKANHIIAVSENTKKDIINILGIPEYKITVIYHGTNTINADINLNIDLPSPFLLFVGERIRYKNFLFLIHSISDILLKENLTLLCTGHPFNLEELDLFDKLNIKNNIFHFFADETTLPYLYKNALAFIFPSFYEGFGIPVLEAFANNCPVVLSNSSCLPEVAKDAALYFDPKNKGELRENISLVIHDNILRKSLIEKGKIRLNDFSWIKAANLTSNIYKMVYSTE